MALSPTAAAVSMVRAAYTLCSQVPAPSTALTVPLIVLFLSEFRMNGFSCSSQSAQFRDFLLRANKYHCLKIVGDGAATDKKLILVEVCNGFTSHTEAEWS